MIFKHCVHGIRTISKLECLVKFSHFIWLIFMAFSLVFPDSLSSLSVCLSGHCLGGNDFLFSN